MNSLLRKWGPAVFVATLPVLLFGQNVQQLTHEQMERFLQTAKITKSKDLGTGITRTRRLTLDDGTMQHDAHVQCIDEHKSEFKGESGTEINFVDTWKYNVAAYRLGRLLDLDMIPVSVERSVTGSTCAVTWWLDKSMMESERKNKHLTSPNPEAWNREMYIVRVFDQLIYNMDRNLGNLMIDPEWRIWMIDHSRSFRLYTALKSKKELVQCDRKLLEKLRALNTESMNTIKPYLTAPEIKGVLGRRDKIVEFFDQEVKAKGESAILYDRPAR